MSAYAASEMKNRPKAAFSVLQLPYFLLEIW